MNTQNDPQDLEALVEALRSLPAQQRAIFLALVSEEASYPILAKRFGIAMVEVEREFVRALIALDEARG